MMWRALRLVFVAMCMVVVTACNNDEIDLAENQRNSIVNYLGSSHQPRLINITEVPNSMEAQPAFYERLDYNTFRYIASYYDEGRDARRAVALGDEVSLTYIACVFTGSKPSLGSVYATNDASVIAELSSGGLNAEYWSTEPLKIKIGQTNIIKGVELSLIGCREGDSVEAYMTLDAAYGDVVVGVVPEDASVVWFYTIDSVGTLD